MEARSRKATPKWVWLVSLLLLAAAFARTLRWLATTWLGNPYYSHGFLVPLISLGLGVMIQRRTSPASSGANQVSSWLGGLWLTLSLVAGLMALRSYRHLIASLALISALGGTVLALGGVATLRQQAFPLAFLLLMIPLPWLERSTPALSRLVASAVGATTQWLGLDVLVAGARVELSGTALIIGAPCSGVNSLAALTTLAVLYAYLVRGRLLARIFIVLLSAPIALIANYLRVVSILLLARYWNVDVALGFFHDWSSPFLFLMALALLITVGRGLGCYGVRLDISR